MPLGMEVGLRPSDFVFDEDPAPPPQKKAEPPPNFRPMSILAKRLDDQDGTWHGGGLRSRQHCARWGPIYSPPKDGTALQFFGPFILWPNGRMRQDATYYGGRLQPRRLCVRWGTSFPLPKKGTEPLPNFQPMSVMAKGLDGSRCHLVRR